MDKYEMVEPGEIAGKALRTVLLFCLAILLSSCAGSKLINDPGPIELTKPLEQSSDRRVTVMLQWVIICGGPGSWVEHANWDEYLLSVDNRTGEDIQITGAQVTDSMGFQHSSNSSRRQLAKASKEVIKRYQATSIEVIAGYGGGVALIAAGVGAGYLASAALDVAVEAALMGGATATGAMAVAANAALVVAPILIVGGVMQGVNNHKVTAEIVSRHTAFPVIVAANTSLQLDLFFPLAPSPQSIDIAYSGSFGKRLISLDTNEVLYGLHVVSPKTGKEDFQADEEAPLETF
jgi:hypothetical protein